MVKRTLLLYSLLLLLLLHGCSHNVNSDKSLSVSILPLKYMVDAISGEDFHVTTVLPPGSNPETHEPLPSQIRALSESELSFQIGVLDFEKTLNNSVIKELPDIKNVNLSEKIGELIHGDHGVDPHVWLSPRRVKKIAEAIAVELIAINPDSTEKYRTNLKTFTKL